VKDAEEAEAILRFALFKEVIRRERRKKRKLNGGRGGEGEDEEDEENGSGDDEEVPERMNMPHPQVVKKASPEPSRRERDPVWGDSQTQADEMDVELTAVQPGLDATGGVRSER
jgi:DNA replication licensing factor MCM3